MGRKFSVLLIVLLTREAVRSIQVTVSTKEQPVAEGRDATLTCRFDIPEKQIYSVKWYKGNKQFYSYTPSSDHLYRTYHVEGVSINVSLSSPHDVTLTGITKETAGLYRCEVIGEGPWFPMGSAEKYIEVYLIPENGLFISGAKDQYTVGDLVDVNCTSQPSRPIIHLTWWINNENARPSQVYSENVRRVDSLNATSTTLRLTFRINRENIPQLTLTCFANIGLIYHSRVTHRARILGVQSPMLESEVVYDYTEATNNHYDEDSGVDADGSSRVDCGVLLVFIYLFSIFVHI